MWHVVLVRVLFPEAFREELLVPWGREEMPPLRRGALMWSFRKDRTLINVVQMDG